MAKKLSSLPPLIGSLDMRVARPVPKVAEAFYRSTAWRKLLASIIEVRGRRCEACGSADGRLIGDHITERKDGGVELDPSNVLLLCLPCHNKKTAREKAKRMAL